MKDTVRFFARSAEAEDWAFALPAPTDPAAEMAAALPPMKLRRLTGIAGLELMKYPCAHLAAI
ncbi:hypothetical protein GCM10011371_04800 [Novosphingobium marinum]|nr:hypothetical protein GCM10011371_04800 [Novosphingobium marinum]